MMSRAVLLLLALGVDTSGAFQAARTTGWTRTTPLMSTNDLYAPAPPATAFGAGFGGTKRQAPPDADSTILVQGGS
eukprot:CAMPEP_0182580864 /NCGR_PEP_ID=MMETSP1324-20130603/48332_1 /TAXON_ID=236786 /ORGANISM="Florenciella sp., Strain RCC1587" /LENGTH=75 /DNA_ID=CAMNT_0024797151 /DNA_START=69 /DNA_END=293 /DNA_ORIENTATION=+